MKIFPKKTNASSLPRSFCVNKVSSLGKNRLSLFPADRIRCSLNCTVCKGQIVDVVVIPKPASAQQHSVIGQDFPAATDS